MLAGEIQHYDFRLMITPFHPIDPAQHWAERYFHAYVPLDSVAKMGANVINVHHATPINPFINYPFLRPDTMRAYIDSGPRLAMRVKIYYTVRELTNHAPELWTLRTPRRRGPRRRARRRVVLAPGASRRELPRRLVRAPRSATRRWSPAACPAGTTSTSRGSTGWCDNDRHRRPLHRRRRLRPEHHDAGAEGARRGTGPASLIDLHSANQYNPRDGFASSANLYLEHFPFIDRLWFGEYFDYNSPPDYWLVEMSGIPFGLMGEMLEGGGNPWRGMLFGMTNRLPWSGDPRPHLARWDTLRHPGHADDRLVGAEPAGHHRPE